MTSRILKSSIGYVYKVIFQRLELCLTQKWRNSQKEEWHLKYFKDFPVYWWGLLIYFCILLGSFSFISFCQSFLFTVFGLQEGTVSRRVRRASPMTQNLPAFRGPPLDPVTEQRRALKLKEAEGCALTFVDLLERDLAHGTKANSQGPMRLEVSRLLDRWAQVRAELGSGRLRETVTLSGLVCCRIIQLNANFQRPVQRWRGTAQSIVAVALDYPVYCIYVGIGGQKCQYRLMTFASSAWTRASDSWLSSHPSNHVREHSETAQTDATSHMYAPPRNT